MNDTTQETKVTRNRLFGREYDYTTGKGAFVVDGSDEKIEAEYDKLPEAMKRGFGLQAFMDFCVADGNDEYRETGNKEKAVELVVAARDKAYAGGVEFRGGVGLGLSSAPAARLVGRALVELGLTFVKFKGETLRFSNESEAQAAMATLYNSTDENTVDAHKLSGRQLFNMISNREDVAAKVKSYRKVKAAPVIELG